MEHIPEGAASLQYRRRPSNAATLEELWALYTAELRAVESHVLELARAAAVPRLLRLQPPAVRDQLWDFRELREVHRRWVLQARASCLVWRAWSVACQRHSTVRGLPSRIEVEGHTHWWYKEEHCRSRTLQRLTAAGDDFFEDCHPANPVPICPRAG